MFRRITHTIARNATRKFTTSSKNSQGALRWKVATGIFTGVLAVTLIGNNRSENAGLFDVFGGGAAKQVAAPKVNYTDVKNAIIEAIDADESRRGDGTSMGPTLVRLAWHASGTYSIFDKTGGSNGATMRFAPESEWGANAGLKIARDFLEPIKKKFPGVSYSDLWTLSGVAAIEKSGGPSIPWRSGRTDASNVDPKSTVLAGGRLPGADHGCPAATNGHIRDIFGRMGFNDREIVALLGAHALGRCHTDASGFWGPWTNAETTFSNEYFRLLLQEKWTLKTTHQGKPWTGPRQYEAQNGELMMLPSDLWLLEDKEFRQYVELYAKDEETFNKDFSAAFSKLLELGVTF